MKILDLLRNILPTRNYIRESIERNNTQLKYQFKEEKIWDSVYHSCEKGISDVKYCDYELIVSLTTFGKRLYDVALTIESIMQGSIKPNRIVLCLEEGLKESPLPVSVKRQIDRGLEVIYTKDIRSYKKLIPTLKKYPEAVVITIDDDVIYNRDVIENLLNSYLKNPNAIHACRIHGMTFQKDGSLDLYRNWNWQKCYDGASHLNFYTGVGGVLYPPHCLDEEVFNESVFMDICKYADDIWFKAMAIKKGTKVVKAYTRSLRGDDYLMNLSVQDVGLKLINWKGNSRFEKSRNDIQLHDVLCKYNLYSLLK